MTEIQWEPASVVRPRIGHRVDSQGALQRTHATSDDGNDAETKVKSAGRGPPVVSVEEGEVEAVVDTVDATEGRDVCG